MGGHSAGCWPDGLSGLWEAFWSWKERQTAGPGSRWCGRDWGPRAQGGGRTPRLQGGRALAPEPSCHQGPGRGRARPEASTGPGSQGTWMVLFAKTLGLRPRVLGGSGNRATPLAAWPASGGEMGGGRVSRPRHAASPGLLALEDASTAHVRAFSGGGERSPAPPHGGGRGRGAPRGSLSGARSPGGQDGRASGPPASGAEGSGGDDGECRPSDGGLELFAHRELNVFVRSGCLSEPAPWAAWTARFTVYSLEAGRPGPGILRRPLSLAWGRPSPRRVPTRWGGVGGSFLLSPSLFRRAPVLLSQGPPGTHGVFPQSHP